MKLYERLPNSVIVNGRRVKCDFSFRNVLRMLDTLARDDLTADARIYIAKSCITKNRRVKPQELLTKVYEILFPKGKTEENKEKLTDFAQDADFIRAAFMQEYGINLYRDDLHWCEFSALLSGLPEGSRYTEILGIRARPMPAPTKWNSEERKWLAKAKAQFAVALTDREARDSFNASLRSVAFSLLSLAEKGGGVDGAE